MLKSSILMQLFFNRIHDLIIRLLAAGAQLNVFFQKINAIQREIEISRTSFSPQVACCASFYLGFS